MVKVIPIATTLVVIMATKKALDVTKLP